MKSVNVKAGYFSILLITTALLLGACSKIVIPGDLPGTYTGKERVIIRYDRGGQYIFRDEYVMVSLMIDSTGHVTGMVGEATLVDCIVNQNRGWIERQLGIKTDFLIGDDPFFPGGISANRTPRPLCARAAGLSLRPWK